MSKIFGDDSDEEENFATNNEYAKNYDNWRKKEELNKLKTKYGDDVDLEDESSSSDDDEEGVELTEEVEKEFYKTLSYLKNKDPRIYDENVKFFENTQNDASKTQKKNKKEKPMFIKDYERKMLLEKNGKFSDSEEEEDDTRARSPTYVQEQQQIKESFKKILEEDEDDEEQEGILKIRQKTEIEKQREEADYKEWLAGQKDKLDDKQAESELKPLKDYWTNPKLDAGEKFLRDYILNKKFLSKEDEDYIPTYEEIVHDSDKDLSDDEEAIETQEEFEHKYNFRFEEPDQDFIKRYPRTMEQSLRKTDDKRKLKRAETKERKQKEKEQKMHDLKKLQEFKRKEIEEKIEKLKEITGNTDIAFQDDDLDGDFDPDAHDKRMQSLFNEEFYEGNEEEQKPEFPELDKYLEIENWEKWQGGDTEEQSHEPHCEDDDFNMDCDYSGPSTSTADEMIENSKGKKKRRRKSLFAKAISEPKPVFDPNDKTYEEYLDEYYKFDCEDIIGDLPCRFKYRKVVPNSFGLSIDEILNANDRELNKWCSLKKAIQHRPDHVEKYDQIAFEKKGQNLELKKRVLPSLFKTEENQNRKPDTSNSAGVKKKGKAGRVSNGAGVSQIEKKEVVEENNAENGAKDQPAAKKKGKAGNKASEVSNGAEIPPIEETEAVVEENNAEGVVKEQTAKKNKKKKRKQKNFAANEENKGKKRKLEDSESGQAVKKPKKNHNNKKKAETTSISDARLSAYGINPKKYKNKLKYGKK